MSNFKSVKAAVEYLNGEIAKLTPHRDTPKNEWLRALYAAYTERFLSDNNRIWSTGAIMIPLSLAPFAILPAITKLQDIHFWVLSLASITVYLAWLVIADGHRQFQDKSVAWIAAIEQSIGIDAGSPKVGTYWLTTVVTIRRMRIAILFELIIGWVVAAKCWPR